MKQHQTDSNLFDDLGIDSKTMQHEKNVQRVCDIVLSNLWILGSFCSKIKINNLNSSKVEMETLDSKLDNYCCKKV